MSVQRAERCCTHLREFLEAEMEVMQKHIQNHKWFQHIQDDNEAYQDFILRYGWLMREMYCGFACPDRDQCPLARSFPFHR